MDSQILMLNNKNSRCHRVLSTACHNDQEPIASKIRCRQAFQARQGTNSHRQKGSLFSAANLAYAVASDDDGKERVDLALLRYSWS